MTDQQDLRARLPELPPNVEEGLHYFFETGDDGDRIYVTAIRQYIAVLRSRITALSQTARVPPELEELSAKATQGELVARVVERDGAFRDAFVTVPSVIQGTSVVGDYPLEWLADDSYNDPADPRQKAHDAQFTAAAINWVRTMLAAAQLGRVGGRASVDEVHAWAERHDITGQYLVAAYEDAAASQLLAGVPDVELLDRIFNEEIKRVSTVEFDSNAICRKFYGELRKRLIEQKPTPQPDNKESR